MARCHYFDLLCDRIFLSHVQTIYCRVGCDGNFHPCFHHSDVFVLQRSHRHDQMSVSLSKIITSKSDNQKIVYSVIYNLILPL
jgi:hypothetical protein